MGLSISIVSVIGCKCNTITSCLKKKYHDSIYYIYLRIILSLSHDISPLRLIGMEYMINAFLEMIVLNESSHHSSLNLNSKCMHRITMSMDT